MDAAGFTTAHLVGNSLGGYARSSSPLVDAPAPSSPSRRRVAGQRALRARRRCCAPSRRCRSSCGPSHPAPKRSSPPPRAAAWRRGGSSRTPSTIAPELIARQLLGVVGCSGPEPLLALALRDGYHVDAEHVKCPVRVVWGTDDALLSWPAAATRYREQRLPHADWVELDGVRHSPQLDVPLEAAQLVLGFTGAA